MMADGIPIAATNAIRNSPALIVIITFTSTCKMQERADRAAPPAACQISTSRSFQDFLDLRLDEPAPGRASFALDDQRRIHDCHISDLLSTQNGQKKKVEGASYALDLIFFKDTPDFLAQSFPAHHQVFSAPFESARHTLSPYPSTSDHKLIDVTERKLRLRDLCGQSFIDALQVAYLLFQLRNGLLFGFGQLRLREIAVEAAENIIIDPVIERKLQMVFVVLKDLRLSTRPAFPRTELRSHRTAQGSSRACQAAPPARTHLPAHCRILLSFRTTSFKIRTPDRVNILFPRHNRITVLELADPAQKPRCRPIRDPLVTLDLLAHLAALARKAQGSFFVAW